MQAKEYEIVVRGKPFCLLAVVSYVKANPDSVSITGEGLESEERIYEDRIKLKKISKLGTVVEAEVMRLETGRMEFEVIFQNRAMRYYLSNRFNYTTNSLMSQQLLRSNNCRFRNQARRRVRS